MPEERQLPKYKSHKEVWALKIKAISPPMSGGNHGHHRMLEWEDLNYAPMPIQETWCERHKPEPGGYYVQYDGYTSYSPAKAFEEGYTAIQSVPSTQAHVYDVERMARIVVDECLQLRQQLETVSANEARYRDEVMRVKPLLAEATKRVRELEEQTAKLQLLIDSRSASLCTHCNTCVGSTVTLDPAGKDDKPDPEEGPTC